MLTRLLQRIVVLAAATFSLFQQPANAQTDDGKEITKRAFVADTTAAEAGKPFRVGFHFQVAPEWHMY